MKFRGVEAFCSPKVDLVLTISLLSASNVYAPPPLTPRPLLDAVPYEVCICVGTWERLTGWAYPPPPLMLTFKKAFAVVFRCWGAHDDDAWFIGTLFLE